jgi:shikimate dehydrogenase
MEKHTVIINTTPLGTSPKTEEAPNIPYQHITESHLFFDLVYNPSLTKFLRLAQEHNAKIQNGLAMLEFQADKAWSLWNTEH